MLIELTSSYSKCPVAIDSSLVGEVRDVRQIGRKIGSTMLIHLKNRRVHWLVDEDFEAVMGLIAQVGQQSPVPDRQS
jgi:hypothetical protein